MAELDNIIDAIIVIQETVVTPSGLKNIALFTDEPPATITVFPAFLNLEDDTTPEDLAQNHQQLVHRIWMRLLFAASSEKYAVRDRRQWLEPVFAKFMPTNTLPGTTLGDTVRTSRITLVDYDPFEWNGSPYIASSFLLEAEVDR